jgi:hypothetical protein
MRRLALLLLATLLAAASTAALAHGRGRVHLGLHFGIPLGGWYQPWYYAPPPAYYYPPVVVQPPAPTAYVERSDSVPEGSASWYFCRESNGYYPYVKTCPGGWERVPARPAQ